jgi:hypothetical protein
MSANAHEQVPPLRLAALGFGRDDGELWSDAAKPELGWGCAGRVAGRAENAGSAETDRCHVLWRSLAAGRSAAPSLRISGN